MNTNTHKCRTPDNEVTEYPYRVIEAVLKNFPDIEEASAEADLGTLYGQLIVAIKCDMELAYKRLPMRLQPYVATLFLKGEDAVSSQAVPSERLYELTHALYDILNVDGVVPWWSLDYRLDTQKA